MLLALDGYSGGEVITHSGFSEAGINAMTKGKTYADLEKYLADNNITDQEVEKDKNGNTIVSIGGEKEKSGGSITTRTTTYTTTLYFSADGQLLAKTVKTKAPKSNPDEFTTTTTVDTFGDDDAFEDAFPDLMIEDGGSTEQKARTGNIVKRTRPRIQNNQGGGSESDITNPETCEEIISDIGFPCAA